MRDLRREEHVGLYCKLVSNSITETRVSSTLFFEKLHKPPWQQNIFSSIIAAMGRQLKQSVKVFQSFMLNLRLPEEKIQQITILNQAGK